MTDGVSFLESKELLSIVRSEGPDQSRIDAYLADRELTDPDARSVLEDMLLETLSDDAIAGWVTVHVVGEWPPFLVQVELAWIDTAFDDVEDMLDAFLTEDGGVDTGGEITLVELPLGTAMRMLKRTEADTGELAELLGFYVPFGDRVLSLVASCSAFGWSSVWSDWVEVLALSLRFDNSVADGQAALRVVGVNR